MSLAERLAAIWDDNLPTLRERMETLTQAATELSETRTISSELREEAISGSHKLAGSLGMFGRLEATDVARAIEVDLEAPGLPHPERLEEHVQKLKALLHDTL